MPAKDLWKKMLKVLFETSHPWNTFKDPLAHVIKFKKSDGNSDEIDIRKAEY